MSLNRKSPSPVTGTEGEDVPAPLSRLLYLRQTVSQPIFAAFLAGGVAGAVSRTVVSPLERLKILFQIQSAGRNEYKLSVGKGLMKMWKEEGWRGLMRGNGTNCLRIVPYSAVQFGSYSFYKRVSAPSKNFTSIFGCVANYLRFDIVCRAHAWRRLITSETTGMWGRRRYHLGHFHLPSRHRSHTTLYTVCIVCRSKPSTAK